MNDEERRIYLAGPMRGMVANNHPLFREAEDLVRWWFPGSTIFNPARLHGGKTDEDLKSYLAPELGFLVSEANTIVFLPGWQGSEGSRIEYMTSRALGHDFLLINEEGDLSGIHSASEWPEHSPIEDEAWRLVYGSRNASYGPPTQDFTRTATMANDLFGTKLDAENVAQFMQLMKMSRQSHSKKRDNLIDKIGYTLCEGRIIDGT